MAGAGLWRFLAPGVFVHQERDVMMKCVTSRKKLDVIITQQLLGGGVGSVMEVMMRCVLDDDLALAAKPLRKRKLCTAASKTST